MEDRLLVGVLGHRDSGKSTTWNSLFGSTVRTGSLMRRLYLSASEYVEVFLVSGSPEERETYVGDIVTQEHARIVLCSMQYREDVIGTINYFRERNFFLHIHWLNPGYHDPFEQPMFDHLGLVPRILGFHSIFGIRSGHIEPTQRVEEIRDFMRGWAHSRNLIIEE